jgi:hypothetical protein
MMTTTFDDYADKSDDSREDFVAMTLSPSAPDRAYDYTVADALLDVRSRISEAIEDAGTDSAGYLIGLRVSLAVVDDVLGEHTSGRIALDSLPPID